MTIERKVPRGILGFPTSPYDQSGNIDEKALEANIKFLLDEGLSAIFIACGSGEFHAIHESEYRTIVEVAVSVAGGKVPVYTGVGGNIAHAVELVKQSEELGADGYLVLPPYLIEGEQEGLYHYYKTIIENSSLSSILYQRDNAIVQLPTLIRLVEEFPQIIGVKDGCGDMELNLEMTQTLGNRLEWLNGMPFAEITMPAYAGIGYRSYSSAISNYIPHISSQYYQAILKGNQQLVRDIYVDVLLPINRIRKSTKGYAISLIKAGMQIMGLPVSNTVRPPVVPVSKEHYDQLETIIKTVLDKYPVENKVSSKS